MLKLKEERRNHVNFGKTDEKIAEELEIINSSQLTSYDFTNNCLGLIGFVKQYEKLLKKKHGSMFSLKNKNYQMVKIFVKSMERFCINLFLFGSSVEFTNGNYTQLDKDFTTNIFGKGLEEHQLKHLHTLTKIGCVAVVGPQSSGKSTLLKRLFGVDAKSSAGRTTQGINFSRIATKVYNNGSSDNDSKEIDNFSIKSNKKEGTDFELILVDTEGVNRIGETTDISERKRSNKIMLGSLASSNVFLLNITRDIRDATLLEPILWAYQRLNLAEIKEANGNKDNKRRLTNIKLILVIRDCQEWTDQAWLNEQKNEIHTRLTECLKTLNKRHKIKENEEKTSDDFISQIIRGIEYFPMPSAFDTESGANPHFSERCYQLRQIIFKHVETCNNYKSNGNVFDNATDWCSNVTQLWDCIVKYEDVLCVAVCCIVSVIYLLFYVGFVFGCYRIFIHLLHMILCKQQ